MHKDRLLYILPVLTFFLGAAVMAGIAMVPGCDNVDADSDGVTADFELEAIPILPSGFPLYPKSLYSGNIDNLDNYESEIDDILDSMADLPIGDLSDYVPSEATEVFKWLFAQRHPFYNPGPLAVAVNQQVAAIFKNNVIIDDAYLDIEVTNNTEDFWGVPLVFSLYIGDGEEVYAKSKMARNQSLVQTEETEECGCTFTLAPGETKTLTTESLTGLIEAMNDLHSLAIDYDADIDLSQIDDNDFWDLMDADIRNIQKWKMTIGGLDLTLSGKGKIEFGDIADWVSEWF